MNREMNVQSDATPALAGHSQANVRSNAHANPPCNNLYLAQILPYRENDVGGSSAQRQPFRSQLLYVKNNLVADDIDKLKYLLKGKRFLVVSHDSIKWRVRRSVGPSVRDAFARQAEMSRRMTYYSYTNLFLI